MQLKVCGMRETENLNNLCQRANPDYIGFIFYPKSKRYFLNQERVIPKIVPPEKRVGVFVNSTMEEIEGLSEKYQLANVQLHGDETPAFCKQIQEMGFHVIKAFGIHTAADFQNVEKYKTSCDFYLFDTKTKNYGGSGQKFNWQILDEANFSKPYFLSGGIFTNDVEAIHQLKIKPFAIDINSRFETEPGIKDIHKIVNFKKELLNYA